MTDTRNNPHGLKVGQEVYYVPSLRRDPHLVKIDKVGRVWATFEGESRKKIKLETLGVFEGDYHCGEVHVSKDDYDHGRKMDGLWEEAYRCFRITYRRPARITEEDLKTIISIMKERGHDAGK